MLTRVTAGLALAAALPLSALAHAGDAAVPAGAPAAAAAAEHQLVVVRDAETGKLRAATADELGALQSLRSAKRLAVRAAPVTPQVKFHRSGATGVRVTEEMLSYSVLVRRADGTMAELCFASKEEADAAVRDGQLTGKSELPTE